MFIYEVSAKFYSLFMAMILLFNSIGITLPNTGNTGDVQTSYSFSNEAEQSAAGTVTVTAKRDGEYDLFWGDAEGRKLTVDVKGYTATYSEFASVEVENGTGSADIYSFTAIPDGAETVLTYKGLIRKSVMELPENKTHETEEPLYNFGALSDVHFNRYYLSLTDDSMCSFPNALSFLDGFGVKLVALSGDLSNGSERDAFEKFNYCASKFDFPVYTCTGNHDVNSEFDKNDWLELVNTGVYGEEKRNGVLGVGVNGLDFVYSPEETHGDVFIFFSQTAWDYNRPESRLVSDEQLDWLEEQLAKYADRRVYLFFHTFLADDTGDVKRGEGNMVNNADHYYDLVYTVGTPDEARFRELLQTYKNVIFFNGHSHWAFDMQKFNPQMNVTDYNGTYATLVHISSVGSPRTITENAKDKTESNLRNSEGYLVSVYDDHIVLTGVNFLRGKMLSYATYIINK